MLEDEANSALAEIGIGDIDAIEQNLAAGIGRLDAGDDPQQRRLARAAGAKQRNEFAQLNLEVNAVQRLERAVGLGDLTNFNAHLALPLGRRASRWLPSRHVWS